MAIQQLLSPQPVEQRIAMSYDEFLARIDENTHAEWVDGEAIIFMSPADRHQALSGFLYWLIVTFVDLFDLGMVRSAPYEMRARPGGSAREPDILFVAREHLSRNTAQRLAGPADLIVEVISPESVRRDQVEKRREYAAAGVPEYWVVDSRPDPVPPVCYRLTMGRYEPIEPDAAGRLYSNVLNGFWLDPAWLSADPLPRPLATIKQIAPAAWRATQGTEE